MSIALARAPSAFVGALVLVVAGMLLPARGAVASEPPELQIMLPGAPQLVVWGNWPINVVFVGYEEGTGPQEVDLARIHDGIGESSLPLVRQAAGFLYGSVTALRFAGEFAVFDKRLHVADAAFVDAFFGHLLEIGVERDLTDAQRWYNAEASRELDIEGPILAIDAVSVEHWLADHAGPMLGIDVRWPTVFLINWYGREDFRFHVYTHTSEPNPDTGVVHGLEDRFTLMAWGGTAADDPFDGRGTVARVWFHDLSAGPDRRTVNWDLTNRDVTGNAEAWAEFYGADPADYVDYRMAPVWEYGSNDDYRPFDDLSGDLTRIVRYVAIDQLFFSSPLFNPTISPPLIPQSIHVDINRISMPDSTHVSVSHAALLDAVGRLQPWISFTSSERDVAYRGRLAQLVDCFMTYFTQPGGGDSCYGGRAGGTARYDLYFYAFDRLRQLTTGTADYDIPVLMIEGSKSLSPPFAGYAGHDAMVPEAKQAQIITFTNSEWDSLFGGGATNTLVHEVGHHLGLSHVHDFLHLDPLRDTFLERGAVADFHFAWTGNQSSTVMSYMPHKTGFSQFQQDSMARWAAMAYFNQGNQLLVSVLESPHARQVDHLVVQADALALESLLAMGDTEYLEGALLMQEAYELLLQAAERLHIPIEPQSREADAAARGFAPFFVDPVEPVIVYRTLRGNRRFYIPPEIPTFGLLPGDLLILEEE
jgi:hypothetical protein